MRRVRRDQCGMTVVEVIVTLAVFSIVSVIVLDFLDRTTSVTARIDSNVQAEKDAQVAMRELTQPLRGATQIAGCPSPTWAVGTHVGWPGGFDNCITFSVSRSVSGFDPAPGACPKSVFAYALVGGKLLVDREDYGANCSVTVRYKERKILDKVVNTAAQPLFTYFNANGAQITDPVLIPSAESVRVHFVVQHRRGTPNLDFKTTVGLRNNNNR